MTERRFVIPPDRGFVLDTELDPEEEEEEIPNILREASVAPAEGRIEPGHVVFDAVRSRHLEMGPGEVRDRNRPPFEWSATDREMSDMLNWTNERISAQDRLRQDNTRKFLETYAFERSKELSRLQTQTAARSNAFRREEESNFRWASSGPQVLERGETAQPVVGGPSPRREDVLPPTLLGPPRVAPFPGESVADARERERLQQQLEERERETTRTHGRMAERERLARISGWLERPEILGVQGLSSEVYGSVESAYVYIKNNMPQFAELEDMNVIPASDEVSVRNLFARLSANMAGHADFLNLPVTALDRTGDRFRAKIIEILAQLNWWKYDRRMGGEFVKRSQDEMREESERSMALPPLHLSHLNLAPLRRKR